MGKVPEIIKPNSFRAEEKKHIYMYINVGGISALRVFQHDNPGKSRDQPLIRKQPIWKEKKGAP